MTSREYKKAINRNTTFEGNLQKDLENIEGQRKRIIRSLREKKLKFIEGNSALPKIRFSSDDVKEPKDAVSPDNADLPDLNKLSERSFLRRKRMSVPHDMIVQETQKLLLTKSGGEKILPLLQPAISPEAYTTPPNSPQMIRKSQVTILPSETKPVLDQQLSLPDKKSSVGGIAAGEDDEFEEHPGMGLFKNSRVHVTFTTLGTQLPHSPLLQRQQQSSKFLNPLDRITGERKSVSLPSSPIPHRRRAESLDTAKCVK